MVIFLFFPVFLEVSIHLVNRIDIRNLRNVILSIAMYSTKTSESKFFDDVRHSLSLSHLHWCNRSKIIGSWKYICHHQISKPVWYNIRPLKNILVLCVFLYLSTISLPKKKVTCFYTFHIHDLDICFDFWMQRFLTKTCNANWKKTFLLPFNIDWCNGKMLYFCGFFFYLRNQMSLHHFTF